MQQNKEGPPLITTSNEECFRILIESVKDYAIYMLDTTGKVVNWNRGAENIIGYAAGEIIGRHFSCFYTSKDRDAGKPATELETAAIKGRYEEEGVRVRKDGSLFWANVVLTAIYDKDKNLCGFGKIIRDISERKKSEIAIRQSEEQFRTIFENAPIGMCLTATDGRFMLVNRAMCDMLGYDKAELMNIPFNDFTHPGDAEKSKIWVKQMLENKNVPLFMGKRYVHKNGRTVWAHVSTSVFEDSFGEIKYFITQILDISDQKKMEQKMLKYVNDLERSNKELEQFAYVASHDLQEPLRMVSSFTQLLSQKYKSGLDQDAQDFINYAVEGASRMQRLINDLLGYSRLNTRPGEFAETDMHLVLGKVIVTLNGKILEKNAVITNDNLPVIYADEGLMIQLLQNLISNSLKFCKGQPRIHVSVSENDSHFVFAVTDNGIGIGQEYSERIFRIFQRLHTREEYPGTGIGLAVCKRIAEIHNGKIWHESEIDKGTVFYFSISKNGNMKTEI